MRILIAEDNQMNQQVMTMYMRRSGWDYVLVENGEEAVEACSESEFDAVLMDIDMPVLDGISAAIEIRRFDASIPIIAITAYAGDQMRDECVQAGMNAFIAKPVSRAEIESVIAECVNAGSLKNII